MLILCFVQLLADLSRFFSQAVTVLPLLTLAVVLCHGKGLFTDLPRHLLTRTLLNCWIAGPLAIASDFALLPANLAAHNQAWVMPHLTDPALVNYTVSIGVWIVALPLVLYAHTAERRAFPLVLALALAALLFFASLCTQVWPFAGLPEGMTASSAFWAIVVRAEHLWFSSLFPCGILLLWRSPAQSTRTPLALLAALGLFPATISGCGVLAGYVARKNPFPPELYPSLGHNALCVALLVTLLVLICCPKRANIVIRILTILVLLDISLKTVLLACSAS